MCRAWVRWSTSCLNSCQTMNDSVSVVRQHCSFHPPCVLATQVCNNTSVFASLMKRCLVYYTSMVALYTVTCPLRWPFDLDSSCIRDAIHCLSSAVAATSLQLTSNFISFRWFIAVLFHVCRCPPGLMWNCSTCHLWGCFGILLWIICVTWSVTTECPDSYCVLQLGLSLSPSCFEFYRFVVGFLCCAIHFFQFLSAEVTGQKCW